VASDTLQDLHDDPAAAFQPTIPPSILRRWLGFVQDRPDLLSSSRYLVLGPELTEILALPEPSAAALTDLLRTLRDHEPEALAYAHGLARHSPQGREAILELAVDELLDADFDWQHPSQVLERPRPEYRELVPVCEKRQDEAGDDERGRVDEVTRKVAKAARISEEARRNRERRRGRQR
jgi:hypothetical protein